MQSRILGWSRAAKRLAVIAVDVVLALLATWIAFTLRLDELQWPTGAQWWVYGLAPVLAVPIFVKFGLYSRNQQERSVRPQFNTWQCCRR